MERQRRNRPKVKVEVNWRLVGGQPSPVWHRLWVRLLVPNKEGRSLENNSGKGESTGAYMEENGWNHTAHDSQNPGSG